MFNLRLERTYFGSVRQLQGHPSQDEPTLAMYSSPICYQQYLRLCNAVNKGPCDIKRSGLTYGR